MLVPLHLLVCPSFKVCANASTQVAEKKRRQQHAVLGGPAAKSAEGAKESSDEGLMGSILREVLLAREGCKADSTSKPDADVVPAEAMDLVEEAPSDSEEGDAGADVVPADGMELDEEAQPSDSEEGDAEADMPNETNEAVAVAATAAAVIGAVEEAESSELAGMEAVGKAEAGIGKAEAGIEAEPEAGTEADAAGKAEVEEPETLEALAPPSEDAVRVRVGERYDEYYQREMSIKQAREPARELSDSSRARAKRDLFTAFARHGGELEAGSVSTSIDPPACRSSLN